MVDTYCKKLYYTNMKLYKDGKKIKDISEVGYLLDGFKWIDGYEGLYMVNIEGVVVSLKRKFSKPTLIKKPYLRKSSSKYKFKKGAYYIHVLSKNRVNKEKLLHRILAETFIENPLNKEEVNHIDGDKLNNNITNLEWVTKSENQKHAFSIGLNKTSINVRKAAKVNGKKRRSITFKTSRKIIDDYNSGVKRPELVSKYGIPYYTVCRIVNGETYKEK